MRQALRLILPAFLFGLLPAHSLMASQPVPGTLDATFGSGGVSVAYSSTSDSLFPSDMVVAPSGQIYVASATKPPGAFTYFQATIVNLRADGSVNSSFGAGGFTRFGGDAYLQTSAKKLAIQGTSILLAFQYIDAGVLCRCDSAGNLDSSFGSGGYSDIPLPLALAVQADGGILILYTDPTGAKRLMLSRYTANGQLDGSFGVNGTAIVSTSQYVPKTIRPLPDGRILVAGALNTSLVTVFTARFLANGAPDTTYGGTGVILLPTVPSSVLSNVGPVIMDDSGNPTFTGRAPSGKIVMAKGLGASFDPSFGSTGFATTSGTYFTPLVLVQRDNGRLFAGTFPGFTVLTCRWDGVFDDHLGSGGLINVAVGYSSASLNVLRLTPDGKLLAYGNFQDTTSGSYGLLLAQYNIGGQSVPVIDVGPVSKTVPVGTAASFTVSVVVDPENTVQPTFQWRLDGQTIAGATAATLNIPAAQLSDEGSLTVDVTNPAGTVTSAAAVLKVIAPPVIVTPPAAISALHGTSQSFTAAITGRTPVTYQWQRNNADCDVPHVSSLLSDTLSVSVSTASAGAYRVIITNADGTVTSDAAALASLPNPPVVLTDPAPQSIVSSNGGSASLTVKVSGVSPFTFQWQKDGQGYGQAVQQDSGTATVVIPANTTESGTYLCQVTNSDGSATTQSAIVTVAANPPVVQAGPAPVTLHAGATTSMSVTVTGRTPFTYQWQKDSMNYGAPHVSSALTDTLPLAVNAAAGGAYRVVVTNVDGTATSAAAALTSLPNLPVVVTNPSPQTVLSSAGSSVTLTVEVQGPQPFSFQWVKGGQNYGAPVQVPGIYSNSLVIPANITETGLYHCVITNAEGSAATDPVRVTVTPNPPVVQSPPAGQAMTAGTGAGVFNVTVTGRPPFTFQWTKDSISYGPPVQQASGTASLSVPSELDNAGFYRCVVSNSDGSATSDAARFFVGKNGTVVQQTPALLLSAGAPLALKTQMFSTQPAVHRTWQFNGKTIPGALEDEYDIGAVTLQDAGSYRMLATTIGGTISTDAATVAVVESGDRTIPAASGKAVSLAVAAAGTGLSYLWHRTDGTPLTAPHYAGMTTATLKINTATASDDQTQYYCEIARAGLPGTVQTGVLTLAVESEKPAMDSIVFPPASVALVFSYQFTASHTPSRFTVTGLPAGLRCDPLTGIVSGTPSVYGTFTVKASATNPVGTSPISSARLVVGRLDRSLVGTFVGPVTAGGAEAVATFSLTVSESGSFTGKTYITFNLGRLSAVAFSGQLQQQPDGSLTGSSKPFNLPAYDPGSGPVRCTVSLQWEVGAGLTGQASTTDNNGSVSYLILPRRNLWNATTNPASMYAGYHTLEMGQPVAADSDAAGSGYGMFTVSTGGTFTLTGRLPDGTAFAVPAFLTQDGQAFIHAWLYGYKGKLSGNISLSTGTPPLYRDCAVAGTLHWHRPASTLVPLQVVDDVYFYGIDEDLGVQGARYLAPNIAFLTSAYMMNGQGAPPSNITVTAQGGFAGGPYQTTASLSTRHVVAFPPYVPGSALRYSSLAFTPGTGVFSGSATYFVFNDNGSVLAAYPCIFQGVVTRADSSSPDGYGAGYYARTYTYGIYDPDTFRTLQAFPVLISGKVTVTPN